MARQIFDVAYIDFLLEIFLIDSPIEQLFSHLEHGLILFLDQRQIINLPRFAIDTAEDPAGLMRLKHLVPAVVGMVHHGVRVFDDGCTATHLLKQQVLPKHLAVRALAIGNKLRLDSLHLLGKGLVLERMLLFELPRHHI